MIKNILEKLREKRDKWLDVWSDASITDEIEDCFYADGMSEAFLEAMKIVQEVAKEYDWIPVSERLPNWEIEDDYTEDVHTVLQWWDGDITYGVGWYRKNLGWSEEGANCKVIAWKPIAPYQKGE